MIEIDGLNSPLEIDFFKPAAEVAPALIGCYLLVDGVGGRIVETEAYDQLDAASHTFAGPSKRNAVMFGVPARAYVYRSYGLHWCMNIVCAAEGHGAGVLIRAIEPLFELDMMRTRRGVDEVRGLCCGPGRLCQALAIDAAHNGLPIYAPPFALLAADQPVQIVVGRRIGISKAIDMPWRFGLAKSRFLSRPFD